jgi:indolepyruvate ferredoxin oxidoreductase
LSPTFASSSPHCGVFFAQEKVCSVRDDIDTSYELNDRYDRVGRRVFLTGTQALVRILVDQSRLDVARRFNTAGFVSGYRGSPLGGLDQELWRQKKMLAAHRIRFEPGLNEDLAATMVWGAQQIDAFPGKKFEGVFSLWYGKGPGVDRSGDVFRNANILGTSAKGGVVAVAGDDHAAQSSMFPHQTDQVFEGTMMPILHPASVEEILSLGLAGIALSRFSGCWTALKAITEVVESGQNFIPELPSDFATPSEFQVPPHGLNYDPNLPWPAQRAELERRLVEERLPAVSAFARANRLDRIVFGGTNAEVGIITIGKAHYDTLNALRRLGIAEPERNGLALLKIALTWPVDTQTVHSFAAGKRVLIVVEEKRSFVERQIREILYNVSADRRPVVVGKKLANDEPLLPATMEFSPEIVERALIRVFDVFGPKVATEARNAVIVPSTSTTAEQPDLQVRKPTFCSGCPHNTSTVVPAGSFASGGIGCHIMALGHERSTFTFSQMGGEGVQWVGLAPFTETPHLFANLGDGTYQHSGILAIRQAVAARARITFKILFNDAVAMTGGQPAEGSPTVQTIVRQVLAEGVGKVTVVTEDMARYTRSYSTDSVRDTTAVLPASVAIRHRDDLDEVQRTMREADGVTVIVYDQTCAAEKRRRRKKRELVDPDLRVFINDRVCEGCGDCSVQSNCISIEPLETVRGRKRQINQSSCNKDISCTKGFCPSFVTVKGAQPRKSQPSSVRVRQDDYAANLKQPSLAITLERPFSLLVTGIGGTGVVTVGAVIAMAAHLEGRSVRTLDFTGLAQKNGAVVSHILIADRNDQLDAVRIAEGQLDLMLGCDLVVAAMPSQLARCSADRTAVVANLDLMPTSDFIRNPNLRIESGHYQSALERVSDTKRSYFINASRLAVELFSDSIAANFFMVGFAYQHGLLPVGDRSIMRAIELNGVSIDLNKTAFLWGRIAVANPDPIESANKPEDENGNAETMDLNALIAGFNGDLVDYQNVTYAQRYRALVERVAMAERGVSASAMELTRCVARFYYKLLAYKDEYEVARLYSDPKFRQKLAASFDGDLDITMHMAPPLITKMDPATGRRKKIPLKGKWLFGFLKLMAHGKRLRGGPFDVFGRQSDRKVERELIINLESDVGFVLQRLTAENRLRAASFLSWPDTVRGYGPVKGSSVAAALAERYLKRAAFEQAP